MGRGPWVERADSLSVLVRGGSTSSLDAMWIVPAEDVTSAVGRSRFRDHESAMATGLASPGNSERATVNVRNAALLSPARSAATELGA